ncbi:hypothetical protein SODG_005972 [Sodalis praecaptivus]
MILSCISADFEYPCVLRLSRFIRLQKGKFFRSVRGRDCSDMMNSLSNVVSAGNDSNLLIVFYVQIMSDDFVMQLHRFCERQ